MIHKFKCEVTQTTEVEVEIDDESVDEKFMAEFRESFYPFTTLKEHAEHLAQLKARGLIERADFVEGYGYIDGSEKQPNAKVLVKVTDEEIEIESRLTSG